MKLVRRFPHPALFLATALAALTVPASASALQFHIVNESGRPASEVFVDIDGAPGALLGIGQNVPTPLSAIPGGLVAIEKLISGRVYISYGAEVKEGVEVSSPTRFDWAELTVTPSPDDVANLTAVDQFGIGMRLTTLGPAGEELESVGSTYADTVFAALQKVPGGPESTVRSATGEILRVLSPLHSKAYPLLTEYVHSMAGQTITLHTPFFIEPFVTSEYSGTFQPDGTIVLTGTNSSNLEPSTIEIKGPELIEDIYTDPAVPNTLEGAIRRDVLAGFSAGFWGGKYGNDALGFCSNPTSDNNGSWCPNGFNQPGFAEARSAPEPYSTYEAYAAAINEIGDLYGNPFSDASKTVTVGLDQSRVKTLQLTILPDSPPAPGGSSGSGNAPAGSAPPAAKPTPPPSQVTLKLKKTTKLDHGKLVVGNLTCKGACGKVVAVLRPKRGKAVLAREAVTVRKSADVLVLQPTKAGKRILAKQDPFAARLTVTVTQPVHSPTQKQVPLRVLR